MSMTRPLPRGASGGRRRSAYWGTAAFLATLLAGCGDDAAPQQPFGPGGPVGGYAVEYSTYIGGSGFDEPRRPVLLSGGRLAFGARTFSPNMPVTPGALQGQYAGGTADTWLGILSADGSALEAGTFFGGSGMERPTYGLAVASNGDFVFTSGTSSPDLPTSAGAFRRNLVSPVPDPGGGYVCRVSGDLRTRRWCTYTGGGWPRGGLILDSQDNVIVVGRALSPSFPVTPGALRSTVAGVDDGFVLILDPTGSNAIYSTRFGGSGGTLGEAVLGVALLLNGDIAFAGATPSADLPTTSGALQSNLRGTRDGFFGILDANTRQLRYLTYLGGSGSDGSSHLLRLPDGSVIVNGGLVSSNGRASTGAAVSRIAADGSLIWSQDIGGSGDDVLGTPQVDSRGRIVMGGRTTSRDLPVTPNALQAQYGGGASDGWLVILGADGTIEYLSYIGGPTEDRVRGVAMGPGDEIYLVGRTDGGFQTTPGAFDETHSGDTDGFVMKLVPTGG